jgi:tetratricopeptide (TPR) repeat protein
LIVLNVFAASMNYLHQACALNNMGSTLIASGQISEGIGALQRALLGIKQATLSSENNIANTDLKDGEASNNRSPLYNITESHQDTVSDLNQSQSQNFVYSRSFELDLMDSKILDDSMISLCSATVLFNLALSYHQQGLQGKGTLLQKALLFYQLSLQVLALEPVLQEEPAALILIIVALNNKANCHCELCDYDQYLVTIEEMADMLYGNWSEVEETLQSDVVQALELNSAEMFKQPPTVAKTA